MFHRPVKLKRISLTVGKAVAIRPTSGCDGKEASSCATCNNWGVGVEGGRWKGTRDIWNRPPTVQNWLEGLSSCCTILAQTRLPAVIPKIKTSPPLRKDRAFLRSHLKFFIRKIGLVRSRRSCVLPRCIRDRDREQQVKRIFAWTYCCREWTERACSTI